MWLRKDIIESRKYLESNENEKTMYQKLAGPDKQKAVYTVYAYRRVLFNF